MKLNLYFLYNSCINERKIEITKKAKKVSEKKEDDGIIDLWKHLVGMGFDI